MKLLCAMHLQSAAQDLVENEKPLHSIRGFFGFGRS